MLMCHEGDTGKECSVNFLSLWVSFMCYVYTVEVKKKKRCVV